MSAREWMLGSPDGVEVTPLKYHEDKRGSLVELWRCDDFDHCVVPNMAYLSWTHQGVVRGPHEHKEQSDLFTFVGPGEFTVWLWENRPDKPPYRIKFQVGASWPTRVTVPPGVVHAYRCEEEMSAVATGLGGLVINHPDQLYGGMSGKGEVDEVRWEADPASPFQLW